MAPFPPDGFPWHELYLNGTEVYRWDPCAPHPFDGAAQTPNANSLFGSGDVTVVNGERPTATQLAEWQVVPD